ncbi:unnamed protein product [Arabidopsis thaliana]|uniref:(thale cress) hypothetical protein n=1 Tax=Arabidopsis thaliana TaxID=3702 RepID=A0A7G2EIT7_ARATH|nr:unnamed protein product [Arabidopsis thaliana]
MLDLNLGILSTHNEDEDCKVPTSIFIQEEDSINPSNDNLSLITFGILKRNVEILPPPPPPPPPPPSENELSGPGNEWLDLSSMQRNKQETLVMKKKSRRGPRSRSSHYRGVTFYRRTGRWESHIWDCGKQVYLGGFDTAYTAARAYDRAAIRFRGLQADINFIMKNLSKEEFVQSLRRASASLARGGSKYKNTHMRNDHIHLFQNRGLNAAAAKCNEIRKMEGDIKLGAHSKENEHNDLELSLGISSSSKVRILEPADYYMGLNRSVTSLHGKPLPGYLPITEIKPLKTVVASSGFPFITMINPSSLSLSCFDP